MNEQAYLITFIKTLNEDDSKNFAGFKIFSKDQAKLYMKSLKKLANNYRSFDFNDLSLQYSEEDFSLTRLSSNDRKIFERIFDITIDEGQIGVFPDAIDDALTFGLMDEYEDTDSENDQDDYY